MHFKLLIAFVDDALTDAVMSASRKSGAIGATVITNAKGQGLEPIKGLFGLEIMAPREIVMVLVESRRAESVLEAVRDAGKMDESLETGIALMLDVDQAVGLREHIRKLEQTLPPA
ncbi:P-II family nitrogen regulator [Natronospirillum operosum]|uniref:P-II family nitrogen regulator n=1 Tax=Natronospirillum operosum TaxID=2759953 RepID=A0A4Z0WEJ4_9GAMM|nr:P-II family nitrogen regulator [Natronospirillum operosum]TGG93882.1 P-II family nitrogen regulator [Natronospirillum operosum]